MINFEFFLISPYDLDNCDIEGEIGIYWNVMCSYIELIPCEKLQTQFYVLVLMFSFTK